MGNTTLCYILIFSAFHDYFPVFSGGFKLAFAISTIYITDLIPRATGKKSHAYDFLFTTCDTTFYTIFA